MQLLYSYFLDVIEEIFYQKESWRRHCPYQSELAKIKEL